MDLLSSYSFHTLGHLGQSGDLCSPPGGRPLLVSQLADPHELVPSFSPLGKLLHVHLFWHGRWGFGWNTTSVSSWGILRSLNGQVCLCLCNTELLLLSDDVVICFPKILCPNSGSSQFFFHLECSLLTCSQKQSLNLSLMQSCATLVVSSHAQYQRNGNLFFNSRNQLDSQPGRLLFTVNRTDFSSRPKNGPTFTHLA